MDGTRKCSVELCEKPLGKERAHYCEMHYYRIRRTGEAGPPQKIIRQPEPGQHVIWSRIEVTGFCWNWRGYVNTQGYGRVQLYKRGILAHRVVYEELVSLIPEGLHLDHLCRNTICVNPDHLEPVTREENRRRGLNGVLTPYSNLCP